MSTAPIGSLDALTVDCIDPVELARFWCEVFATKVDTTEGDPVQYVDLLPAAAAPAIRFQRVPEPKTVKDRLHLDILVDDLPEAIARVEGIGAKRTSDGEFAEDGYAWQVMLDPEGNEFCLVWRED